MMPLLSAVPLLAFNAADAFKIVFVVMMVIYAINSLIGRAARPQTRPPMRPPARPPEPRGVGPRGASARPRPTAARQSVEDEVSQFLKRAAEKRGARSAEPARGEPSRRLVELSTAEVVEAQAVEEPPTGAGVARHVEQRLGTREFNERASHLSHVEAADTAIESHLQDVFAHDVGHLAQRTAETQPAAAPAATPAELLASALATPQGLRSAVILREIIERPTQRW